MSHNYTWIYGLWFVGSAQAGVDWLCQLTLVDGAWQIDYRFRYYSGSEDPWDGTDRKSGYRIRGKDGSAAEKQLAVEATQKLIPLIELRMGSACDFVLLDCPAGDPKIHEELSKKSWCHVRRLTLPECQVELETWKNQ